VQQHLQSYEELLTNIFRLQLIHKATFKLKNRLMSFIGTKSSTTLLKELKIIEPFDESRIKNGSYELSLGTI
jgi:hypothetical protein